MDPVKNFAYGIIQTPPSPATSGNSFTLTSGQGAKFPAPGTDGAFNAVVWPVGQQPTSENAEIVRVTGRTSDTFTITRAQEGSSAMQITAGYQVALTITAKTISDIKALIPSALPVPVNQGGTGSTTASGARTNLGLVIGTDVQAHDADLDTWATKTAPSGTVLGNSDAQTLTNKDLTSSTNTFPTSSSGFGAYIAGAQNATAGADTKVSFDTEEYDLGSEFDSATNHRFTATKAGKYLFIFTVNLQMAASKQMAAKIFKNGSVAKVSYSNSSGATNQSATVTAILSLAISDYVEFYVNNGDASDRAIQLGASLTYASGQRLV